MEPKNLPTLVGPSMLHLLLTERLHFFHDVGHFRRRCALHGIILWLLTAKFEVHTASVEVPCYPP